MLYMQSCDGKGKEVALVFSDKDSIGELHRFRCMVRAPRYALHESEGKGDRTYLALYGRPRELAMSMLVADVVFDAPIDRVLWERQRPAIMRRHPKVFITPQHDSIVEADNEDKERIV